jgi:hypothetical protein
MAGKYSAHCCKEPSVKCAWRDGGERRMKKGGGRGYLYAAGKEWREGEKSERASQVFREKTLRWTKKVGSRIEQQKNGQITLTHFCGPAPGRLRRAGGGFFGSPFSCRLAGRSNPRLWFVLPHTPRVKRASLRPFNVLGTDLRLALCMDLH